MRAAPGSRPARRWGPGPAAAEEHGSRRKFSPGASGQEPSAGKGGGTRANTAAEGQNGDRGAQGAPFKFNAGTPGPRLFATVPH